MKLIFCENCFDVVKLDFDMRYCKCGLVCGRYLDELKAEVNEKAISIMIDGHSMRNAIRRLKEGVLKKAGIESYIVGKLDACVRENSGATNPNTKVIKE